MRESSVEAVLFTEVKTLGGWSLKIMPTIAGMPDRLVVLPGGRHFLVELKRSDTKASRLQEHRHQELGNIGHPVAVLHGAIEVRAWIAEVSNGT